MSRIPPLYICPDCEGHKAFSYAGRIISKVCSECAHERRHARTGADRVTTPLPLNPFSVRALEQFAEERGRRPRGRWS